MEKVSLSSAAAKLMLSRSIPSLSNELEGIISLKSLRVKKVGVFNPGEAITSITRQEGKLVTAFDIGGQKTARQVFQAKSGQLVPVTGIDIQKGIGGDTYLTFLQESEQTPFTGISCAGFLDGTILEDSPNAKIFVKDLHEQFGGDIKLLFKSSRVSLNNDAVAGVKAAGVEVLRRNPNIRNVLFVINGGGFGLAALIKDPHTNEWQVMASEPGHIKAPSDLNVFHRKDPCGAYGASYTCIEKVIASGAGIEKTYQLVTGHKLDGREISRLHQDGNELATSLYDASAIALAQVIYFEEKTLGLKPSETAIVYHGGTFEVPGYLERVTDILEKYEGQPHLTFKSKDISDNIELLGAAIASLIAG